MSPTPAVKATFESSLSKLLPSWLNGNVALSLARVIDTFATRAKSAMTARWPAYAPDDALAAIGRDRKIVRGINEPSAVYAERLARAIDDHHTRGNPWTMLEQLRAYLQADCVVRTVDRRGNWYTIEADGSRSSNIDTGLWNWDGGAAAEWARFWVIIYPVNGTTPWAPSSAWGDADLFSDGLVGHTDRTIGTTATPDQVASVRQIIRDWKLAGTTCEWIIIAFDDTSFTPSGSTDPAGEWGSWGNHTGAPVRLSSARYWRGVDGT